MIKSLLLSLTTAGIMASCSKEENLSEPMNASTQLNVAYGSHALQKMDVYLPANRTSTSTKVMIMIHGGAWSSGDKTDFNAFVDTLKRRFPAYALFNINYRLASSSGNIFPAQEEDVKAAVEFIYNRRSEYGISGKFVMLGGSAGGHLALLHAYKYNNPVKIKAVVDFFGPTDMADMYNNPASPYVPPSLIAALVGGTPTSHPQLYQQSSPLFFATSAAAVPTIMIHGGLDPLVRASQSVALQTQLNVVGVVNQYVYYPNGGHGDWNNATYNDAFNKVQSFLQANVP